MKISMNGLQQIVRCLLTGRYCLYVSAVDFFNEISLIWGIVCDVGIVREAAGVGFPPGFEYRWSDGSRFKTPISCSGSEYVEHVMNWVEKEINNDSLFPTSSGMFSP